MLWEVEIRPRANPPDLQRVQQEYDLLCHGNQGRDLIRQASRGYLLEGNLDRAQVTRLLEELLCDPLVEDSRLTDLGKPGIPNGEPVITVLPKPGVMDPVAQSVVDAARNLDLTL